MKIIVAILLGCSIALFLTGSPVGGGFLLVLAIIGAMVGNKPRRPKDPAVPRDRLGWLDGLFGGE
ncbi:hypothetical protein F8M49_20690 [Rhodococcus zopfii]|uniref:DUF2273 domain-containing protein n=1 Tax=Rhodococcus zopfii TaxID=43772 RepID=A0ABU3WT26_9NOCA|nr:hypothetical protein [Rhodococcus zopfii]